jgi:formylmethanofuran dehydrogenase subunit E
LLDKADPTRTEELECEAENFHGERCSAVIAGVRLIQFVSLNWNVMPKDDELRVSVPMDPAHAHLVDAIQGLTAATFGTGRLSVADGGRFVFRLQERELDVEPLNIGGIDAAGLRTLPIFSLFAISPV